MSQMDELKSRIEAKKKQLEADLAQAKADAKGTQNDTAAAIEAKLAELRQTLGDDWDNLSESVAKRVNDWLKKA